jgi:hypothetical protein
MTWKLEGTYFENCSCEVACPCTAADFAVPADYDRCQFLMAFHVDSGDIDGVGVSDRTVAVVGDSPGRMLDGGWRVGLLVDDRASAEETEKLSGVFSGQMGGPMGALSPLLGEVLGVETTAIEYADEGRRHRVRIGTETRWRSRTSCPRSPKMEPHLSSPGIIIPPIPR